MSFHRVGRGLFFAMLLVLPLFSPFVKGLGVLGLPNSTLFQALLTEVFVVLITACVVAGLVRGEQETVRVHVADAFFAGFLVLGAVLVVSDLPHTFDSLRRLKELGVAFLIYLSAKHLLSDPKDLRRAATVACLGLAVVSILGIGQYFTSLSPRTEKAFVLFPVAVDLTPWERGFGVRAGSTFGNPNFLADYLVLLLPLSAVLLLQARSRMERWTGLLGSVLGFACLLLTNSWGGWMAFLASAVVLGGLWAWRPGRVAEDSALFGFYGLCAAALCAVVFFVAKGKMVFGEPTGIQARTFLWDAAWRMAKQRPVIGWGLDAFFPYSNVAAQTLSRQAKYDQLWINNAGFVLRNPGRPHNEYLTLLVEGGLVGAVLFLGVFAAFFASVARRLRAGPSDEHRLALLAGAAGIGAILVQSVVNYPLRLSVAMVLTMTVMGLALSVPEGWRLKIGASRPRAVVQAGFIALAAALLAVLFYQIRGVRALVYLQGAAREKDLRGVSDEVVNRLSRAIALRTNAHEAYFEICEYLLDLGRPRDALEYLDRLERIQPCHEKVFFLRGEAYRQLEDTDRAVDAYARAVQWEPRYLQARLMAIDMLVNNLRFVEAERWIGEAKPYKAETDTRLQRAFEEQARTSAEMAAAEREGRRVPRAHYIRVVEADTLYPWIPNAEAMIAAADVDLKTALEKLGEAQAEYEKVAKLPPFRNPSRFTLTGNVFELNRQRVLSADPAVVSEDLKAFLSGLIGPGRWEWYRRQELAYMRRLRQGDDRKYADAMLILNEVARRLPPEIFVVDGNFGREYHNRLGLCRFGQMGVYFGQNNTEGAQVELQEAVAEFERSRASGGSPYVAIYNMNSVRRMGRLGAGQAIFVDDTNYGTLEGALGEAVRQLRQTKNAQAFLTQMAGLRQRYPFYLPIHITTAEVLIQVGNLQNARAILEQADTIAKGHPRVIELLDEIERRSAPVPQ